MPYDPEFIPGFAVPLPSLGQRIQAAAFNGGEPIDHTRFSIIFNEVRGFAVCTAHNIDGATIIPEGVIQRNNSFRLDPNVPNNLQVDNDRGYVQNPWDRGHLVRRRSLHWQNEAEARQADSESFYWTNIVPQHENLHDTAWGHIEDWMFDVADDVDRQACVFTGPVLTQDDPEHTNRPGEMPILIPAGFWKIFVLKHQDRLRAAAFLTWQRDFDQADPVGFDPILEQVRVSTLEYLTGLGFGELRNADPLRFGAELQRIGPRMRMRPATARSRAAVVTRAEDIVL